ncbi:MAG TPA: amino acid adenylation domain-containing protein [Ktedonobacteraceae bacterium]|nr:amino acid adenylation domain-containing protein [Ktedonobacteraceae bacterium]
MSDTTNLSEARRALLEKLLRGDLPQATNDAGGIPRRKPDGLVPLSFMQQPFWLLSQFASDIPAYNLGIDIHLPGSLDAAALQQSLDEIIRRHEAWRTSFPLVDEQPVQRIHPPYALPLAMADVSHLPEAEREAEALRLGTALVNQPFDLSKAPPVRALLIRLADAEHRLFLALHHIISDGFSSHQVFLPELSTLYQAFSSGQPSSLPELPIQYADYAIWQHETLQGEALEKLLSYWRDRLAHAPDELVLPTDHPRPLSPSGQGAVQAFTLPKHLGSSLLSLSQQEGTTLFTVLLAAFATLLNRYSGQEDIIIGTPTSGRSHPAVQGLLGVFINTLALRISLSGNPSFREVLNRAREVVHGALAHEALPFEQLVRHLRPERAAGQNPFIQVMLNLQPPAHSLPSGWRVSAMALQNDLDRFDLSLDLEEGAEGVIGFLKYNTDLFEAQTIQRMIGHWQTLLEGLVAHPDQPIATLPLLTEAERQQTLIGWNATQAPYPNEQVFHQLFEAQVERSPDAVAVVDEHAQLTYRQLNERANQLAHYLLKLGVGPDVLVGLYVDRSVDMLVGLLGIHKAGGAYVPLDPIYPTERLTFMLEDSQAAVLVTQERLRSELPTSALTVVCLDTDLPLLDQQPGADPPSAARGDHLAYVIYTSGSTGKPKGVQVLQRALVNFLLSMRQQPGITATDRLLAVTTLSFDIAGLELFLPLLVGACVIIASRETAANGADLALALKRSQATVMQATPVTWRLLLAAGWQGNPSLKLLCGGEALPLDLARQLLELCGTLWNLYGPTETTIWSTARQITAGDSLISIGRPIANTQIFVLDTHLQPVPIGVPGELFIGGDGLARGYHRRPDLTAEKFVSHPFSTATHARLYRTGDLARFLPTGELEHLGRLDYQVKIRGFRIELGEIEAVLSEHSSVRQAVVVAREDTPGNKLLVAYIVLADGEAPTITTLRGFLKERLPDYMVPAAFIPLDKMPLTPNNKIDRRALPAPDASSRLQGEEFVAPRTPTEEQLAAIWAELLGLPRVSVTENFFALGGHSLLAVRVLLRIQERLQVELPLSTIFEAPTIAELALKLVQRQAMQVDEALLTQLLAELEDLPETDAQAGPGREQDTVIKGVDYE